MSTRTRNAWTRRILALILAPLALLGSLGLTAGVAAAQQANGNGGGGGNKATTTTTPPSNSSTTTVASTGGGGNGVANPKLTAVTSLSLHRVLATYDRDLDAAALQVSSYAFHSTQAVNLPVTGVSRATNNQAYVTTAAQEPVTYTVKLPKTSRPITFTGSTVAEPKVVSAEPLSRTQILITFSEPMGPSAFLPTSYQINVQGSSATLNVTEAAQFGSDKTKVLITTAPQEPGVKYMITFCGCITNTAGTGLDPGTTNTTTVTGSSVAPGPMMLSASSDGDSKVILTFSAPLNAASAANTANYTVTPGLTIQSATLQGDGRQVVLVTGPQFQIQYSLVVKVTGADGNPVNPGYNSTTFTGNRPVDTSRPKVVSAGSTGNKSVVVQFSKAMADSTADPGRFAIVQTVTHPEVGALVVTAAEFTGPDRQSVKLTTMSQAEVTYQVTVNNVTDATGSPLADRTNVGGVLVDPTSFSFPGTPPTECPGNPPPGTVTIADLPDADLTKKSLKQLIGSGSDFQVTFKVGDNVAVAGETVRTISKIVDKTHLEVSTAFSTEKSGLSYRISCPDEPVNSDGDTLYDHEETRGWQITIALANSESQVRQVTSSPFNADTDGDGLKDDVERSLNIDPRDRDTDDDGLSDYSEFNEIFSDPTRQDTDGDALFDGLEVTFFRTSATRADTDGDQLADGVEINLANRNPRVADLPKPTLEIGEMNLTLDVRFEDTTSAGTTVVDTKTKTAGLVQSESQEFSHTDSQSVEASTKLSQTAGFELEAGTNGIGVSVNYEATHEQGSTQSYTTGFTDSSKQEATRSYEDSLTSSAQQDASASRARRIDGAQVTVTATLKNIGDIPFSVRNLQVTALTQDAQNPGRLTPIATLTPQVQPDGGFNLGPLVPERGPIVMTATPDRVFPAQVEELMRNPRSVVFRFSNYDITDEAGHNFAFSSQDVFNNTASLVIDYGGADSNDDREGDISDIIRVASGIGRWVADTDGDGAVSEAEARGPRAATDDPKARWVAFDANGKQVPITLREALQAAGLTEYNEATAASSSLSVTQKANSYSVVNLPNIGERLFRVRGVQRAASAATVDNLKEWQIHTANGLDRTLGLDTIFLSPASGAKLLLAQDADRDGLPAVLEWMNNCSDTDADSDDDRLDDRFEVSIGWNVSIGTSGQLPAVRRVHPRCDSGDSDNDALLDIGEAPGAIEKDAAGLIRIDTGHLPQRKAPGATHTVATYADLAGLAAQPGDLASVTSLDVDGPGPERPAMFLFTGVGSTPPWVKISAKDPMKDTMADYITNPASKDTDGDGALDGHELTPHQVTLRFPPPDALDCPEGKCTLPLMTSGEWRDSDGDTASDGLEGSIGGDPTQSDRNNFADDDGDGLVNVQETTGWKIRFESLSISFPLCQSVCSAGGITEVPATSNPGKADSDGDGLSDFEEMTRGTNPSSPDSDVDGITDPHELQGYDVAGIGTVKTDPLDSDSDNDKRSDGAELGRTTFFCGPINAETCGTYIVRVEGEVPYEVAASNPTKADADLDMLVDGDELATGTDPTKFNTDGDTKSDYDELGLSRNPLLPDMHVTMTFARLFVAKDADPGGDSGDFKFDFDVVDAAGTTKTGMDSMNPGFPKCGDEDGWLCWFNDTPSGQRVVHINDGQTLLFPSVTVDAGLVSTSPKVPQNITIKGHLLEDDDDKEDCSVYLPDLSATGSDGTSVLNGSDLKLGTNVVVIHRIVKCLSGEDLEFTLVMSYTAK